MNTCPKCGAEVEGIFCPECGHKMEPTNSQPVAEKPIVVPQDYQETHKESYSTKKNEKKAGIGELLLGGIGPLVKGFFDMFETKKGAIVALIIIGALLLDCLFFCIYSNVVMKNKSSKSMVATNSQNEQLNSGDYGNEIETNSVDTNSYSEQYQEETSSYDNETDSYVQETAGSQELSYDEIVELARIKSGAPLAELDSITDDGMLFIHLYEDMGDHTATWDWYEIDPKTLVGTDFNGEEVNLNDVTGGSAQAQVASGSSFNESYYAKQQEYYGIWSREEESGYTEYLEVTPMQNGSHLYIVTSGSNNVGGYSSEQYYLYGKYNTSDGYIKYDDGYAEYIYSNANGYGADYIGENYSGYLKCDGTNLIWFGNGDIGEHSFTRYSSLNINTPEEYMMPLSGDEFIPEFFWSCLSKEELRIARNEILARYGRTFKSDDLTSYFSSKSWYNGRIDGDSFDANMQSTINDYEKQNIEMIKAYENR